MSKIVKGVKKGLKKIFKGAKKVFKKITSSTIGKVLLGTAIIAFGGAALGLWGGASSAGAAGLAGTGAAAGGAAASTGISALTGVGAGTVAGGASLGASTVASSGFWGSAAGALKAGASYAAAHPVLTQAALQGISAATTPDELDIMKEQEKQRRRDIERQNKNLEVGSLNVGLIGGLNPPPQVGEAPKPGYAPAFKRKGLLGRSYATTTG